MGCCFSEEEGEQKDPSKKRLLTPGDPIPGKTEDPYVGRGSSGDGGGSLSGQDTMERQRGSELDRSKGLRKQKPHASTQQAELHERIRATLGTGAVKMRDVVKLPRGESLNAWLAVHITDFYNDINALYGTISELCTDQSCPTMSAGPKYTYLWADGVNITTPIKVPAPDYIGYLLEWVDGQISNPQLMPTNNENFPPDFQATAKTIFKRLFRVYAHIYHSHFPQYVTLQLEAHLNTCFKRYVYFVAEFDLVEAKELAPLQQLISSLLPSE